MTPFRNNLGARRRRPSSFGCSPTEMSLQRYTLGKTRTSNAPSRYSSLPASLRRGGRRGQHGPIGGGASPGSTIAAGSPGYAVAADLQRASGFALATPRRGSACATQPAAPPSRRRAALAGSRLSQGGRLP